MMQNKKLWISIAVFLIVSALYFFFKIEYHELWKDEWQPWLLARDKSLAHLLRFLHQEGHPALWFCYLVPWASISNSANFAPDQQVLLFEIAHGLLFVAALAILLFRFQMPLLLRIATAGSFFFFYEYGIVNRGYMLLIVLSFLLFSLLKEKGKTGIAVAVLLFLICQTEVYGVFAAGGLFICLWWDYYQKEGQVAFVNNKEMRRNAWALFSGVFVFVLTVFPRGTNKVVGLNTDALLIDNIAHSFQGNFANAFWIGLIPDTNVFGYGAFGLVASLVLLGLVVAFFWRDKGLLVAFLVYMLAAVVFGTYIYQGGVRHWGVNFIFFVGLVELYFRRNGSLSKLQMGLIASFMLCQFYYNYLAIDKDLKYPFSNARITAAFINEKIPTNVPIMAINKFETAPVVAYSGRTVYALPTGEPFTYYQWLDKVYMPPEKELTIFAKYKKKSGLVILSPKPLNKDRYPNVELWKAFDGYNMKNENYYVYLLEAGK